MENKFISVAYKLYTIEDGEKDFAEEAPAEKPFEFISGLGLTLPEFEENVKDLNEGDTFDFVIKKENAYGIYDERQVVALPKKTFEIDGKFDSEHIVEGAIIPLMNAEGQRFNASVSSISPAKAVTLEKRIRPLTPQPAFSARFSFESMRFI